MTRAYKDYLRCKDCEMFYLILPKLMGTCEYPGSDHYGHCIAPEHPACKEWRMIV